MGKQIRTGDGIFGGWMQAGFGLIDLSLIGGRIKKTLPGQGISVKQKALMIASYISK
jgi:hypothetical protein